MNFYCCSGKTVGESRKNLHDQIFHLTPADVLRRAYFIKQNQNRAIQKKHSDMGQFYRINPAKTCLDVAVRNIKIIILSVKDDAG